MQNYKRNFPIFTNWFIKSICIILLTGIITLISLPILSLEYPLIALFKLDAITRRTVKNNLVITLENDDNFENLVAEIKMAGLTEKLEGEQFTTLLAFSDEAFDTLPDDIYDKFTENRKKVLQYHLIPGQVTQEDLDRGKIVTVEGNIIPISSHNGNKRVKFKNANLSFPSTPAINGVIIEIDQVLFPPDF